MAGWREDSPDDGAEEGGASLVVEGDDDGRLGQVRPPLLLATPAI